MQLVLQCAEADTAALSRHYPRRLLRPRTVGIDNVPNEIWLIKINPTGCKNVPKQADEIYDRHNQLEGNFSLFQQLEQLELINDLILGDALRPDFLAQLDIQAPIRVPKSSSTAADRPYHIPCIEMPEKVQETLDYEGKLDRSAANIDRLMPVGEESAREFLEQRMKVIAAASGEAGRVAAAELKKSMWRKHAPGPAKAPHGRQGHTG
ncbi:MAG: hypothetical protein ACREFP_24275 [Acetobacteraceae bacterium]